MKFDKKDQVKYIVLMGSMSGGFEVVGKFKSEEEADSWVKKAYHPYSYHEILPIMTKEYWDKYRE